MLKCIMDLYQLIHFIVIALSKIPLYTIVGWIFVEFK
nr:MAG TPA: hypothetical protein [Caudoviricetes sp.]